MSKMWVKREFQKKYQRKLLKQTKCRKCDVKHKRKLLIANLNEKIKFIVYQKQLQKL